MTEVRRLLDRDWLRLNGRARRNAERAMRSDARRALEREAALRALGSGAERELQRAQ